jgi:hypothetical protein
MTFSAPTPDDIREIVAKQVQAVFQKVTPYINNCLEKRAREFISKKKIYVDLRYIESPSSMLGDAFELSKEFPDHLSSSKINWAMASELIKTVEKEYKEFGWDVVSSEGSYYLEFYPLEDWNESEPILEKDEETTRSELLDLES